MTQSIVIQVGQCGNQIGSRFWDLAMKEHMALKKTEMNDLAMSTFFSQSKISNSLGNNKARAVLIDMEEGVVNEIMKSPIRDLFDHTQLITDVSGSGNNWATGYYEYGNKYSDKISEVIRKSAELCDCLQCFFVLHSMGGGTGSGVGTKVLSLIADEYPEVYRFVSAIYPSDQDDDVITSPYNSLLAMHQLTSLADCVVPIENSSLIRLVNNHQKFSQSESTSGASTGRSNKHDKPFDSMNNIVANVLLNLTSSSRFEGTMNVDLNEISMNLVPFPRLHYLVASQSPIYLSNRPTKSLALQPRKLDQIFTDSFSKDFQLLDVEPRLHTYLACGLLVRGAVEISDIRRNIQRQRNHLNFINWNREGWKVGLCSVPPTGQKYALLNLSNNTAIYSTFDKLLDKFNRLYKRKAHIHHYTQVNNFPIEMFQESCDDLVQLRQDYFLLDSGSLTASAASNNPTANSSVPQLKIAP